MSIEINIDQQDDSTAEITILQDSEEVDTLELEIDEGEDAENILEEVIKHASNPVKELLQLVAEESEELTVDGEAIDASIVESLLENDGFVPGKSRRSGKLGYGM